MRYAILTLTLLASVAVAAPPAEIRVPSAPVVPQPMPAPDSAIRLTPELLFVVDSDVPVMVLDSPRGKVKLVKEAGPLRVRGMFADNPGQYETRTFEGKHIWLVEPVADGRAELLIVPVGADNPDAVIRRTVEVETGHGPQPPPKPVDPVEPTPEPKAKSPWDNAPGLRVLIVYPKRDALPAEQQAIVTGRRVRDYLDAKTVKENGQAAYWILKTDENVSGLPATWQKAYATAEGDRWVVVGNGDKWTAEVMPKDVDAMLELLGRYQ